MTPDKVLVQYQVAGLGSRFLAHLIDVLIYIAGLSLIFVLIGFLFPFIGLVAEFDALFTGFLLVVMTFLPFAFFILQEGLWRGKTIGKHAMGIRVIMMTGEPITWQGAIYRNVLRIGDFLPGLYGAGVLTMILNRRSQRLGDLVAGTIVIRTRNLNVQFNPAPHRVGEHPLERYIPSLQQMTPEEYFALKRLADRFPELPTTTQARSVQEIWEPFAERHQVPSIKDVHPVYLMEAVVMKYSRDRQLV